MLQNKELSTLDGQAPTAEIVMKLADALRARGWLLSTAESCTGGLIAAACTDLAGVPIHEGAARYYREVGVLE